MVVEAFRLARHAWRVRWKLSPGGRLLRRQFTDAEVSPEGTSAALAATCVESLLLAIAAVGVFLDGPAAREAIETSAPVPGDSFVQSFARGLAVIRSFSAETPEQTLSEVAERTGLTRAGARRILLTC